MQTKGQSMTLSYWRERCTKAEEDTDYWLGELIEEKRKVYRARRIAGNQRSQKNYWKKKAVKLQYKLDRAKAALQAQVRYSTSIKDEYSHLSYIKNANTYINYALIALWIIWS